MAETDMRRAGCTIVSLNYLPFARTLCESFLRAHPGCEFYVLLVDRVPAGLDLSEEKFQLITAEELGIPDFESIAFKYDILELNTNVKPTFLRTLLERGISELVYLDPDIRVYRELTPVFAALENDSIVLTPHILSPVQDGGRLERNLLAHGVFNLGFIAVRKSAGTDSFLRWWEERCLHTAYAEPRAFMFVDQRWVDLAPCLYERVELLKHPGCNIAHWNLHERHLSRRGDEWIVNETDPLLFFHFSGASVDGGDQISKRADQFTLVNRPDLRPLFEEYRGELVRNGIRDQRLDSYAFGRFDSGETIQPLFRSLYAASLERFGGDNPFHSSSKFYAWLKARRLLGKARSNGTPTATTVTRTDPRLRRINRVLRWIFYIIGPRRYALLMKYCAYISLDSSRWDVLGD
jgi:hypothetical protein